jgi:AraC family transcriptional regulator
MDYKEHIAKAITYIEENLKNDIDLYDCAKECGYSEYHFLRVFKEVAGMTPSDYIRKRRLSEIAKRISNLDEHISEIAFLYGFNSKENFTRAFKSEFHILPTEYKSALNSLKLCEPLSFEVKSFFVIPELITLNDFTLVVYKSDEDYPPNFWNKYNAKKLSLRLSKNKVCKDFGVSIWNDKENKIDYFIGINKENALGDLKGTVELLVKGGLYAMFRTPKTSHDNFINTIHNTWNFINNVWLPSSRFNRKIGYEFECYVEESRTFSEKIYIPIEPK